MEKISKDDSCIENNNIVADDLKKYFTAENVKRNTDALLIFVHVLALKEGFKEKEAKFSPVTWSDGLYVLDYIHESHNNAEFRFIAVLKFKLNIVGQIKINNDDWYPVSEIDVNIEDFITDLNYENPIYSFKDVSNLSKLLKESIYSRLIAHYYHAFGYEGASLLYLATEIQLRIFSYLDPSSLCRLQQTCKQLNTLCGSQKFWKLIYERDFSFSDIKENNIEDWKEAYKKHYVKQKELKKPRIDREEYAPIFYDPFSGQASSPAHGFGPPGMIGGNYDLDPFGHGMPGSRPRLPGGFLRPRFDPLNPNPYGGPPGPSNPRHPRLPGWDDDFDGFSGQHNFFGPSRGGRGFGGGGFGGPFM